MAKAKAGLITIEGKIGGHIISRRGRYKSYIRKVVEPGTKKNEPALKQQYSRTGFLNSFASDINTIIKENSDGLKSSQFYEKLQSRFRKEPENNRLLLLQNLKGMEINPSYPFEKHGMPDIDCTTEKTRLRVRISAKQHPASLNIQLTDYYYEVLAATWLKKEGPGDCERQYSEWVHIKNPVPVFDFFFEKPAGAIHWMVCVRIRLGLDEVAEESFKADGMLVADCGSFDKREQEWLLARNQTKKKPVGRPAKQPVKIVRVKPSNKN
jgi:hypothetical protein